MSCGAFPHISAATSGRSDADRGAGAVFCDGPGIMLQSSGGKPETSAFRALVRGLLPGGAPGRDAESAAQLFEPQSKRLLSARKSPQETAIQAHSSTNGISSVQPQLSCLSCGSWLVSLPLQPSTTRYTKHPAQHSRNQRTEEPRMNANCSRVQSPLAFISAHSRLTKPKPVIEQCYQESKHRPALEFTQAAPFGTASESLHSFHVKNKHSGKGDNRGGYGQKNRCSAPPLIYHQVHMQT